MIIDLELEGTGQAIPLILQMRKQLEGGHIASKLLRWDVNSVLPDSKSSTLPAV